MDLKQYEEKLVSSLGSFDDLQSVVDEMPSTYSALAKTLYYIFQTEFQPKLKVSAENETAIVAEIKQKFPKNAKVTAAGHAMIRGSDNGELTFGGQEKTALPTWLLRGLVDYGSADSWPVFIPATLTLLDSPEIALRAQGCLAAKSIAEKYKAKLETSGLRPLFQEAIKSCLHYLPPSSKAEETMLIERPAVVSLLALATNDQELDAVMREGPLRAFRYTQQNVKLIIYLLDLVRTVADRLGPRTIIHLKELIHIFMAILADPYIDTSPELVEAACSTMSSVLLRHCAPRMPNYRYDVLYALAKAKVLQGPYFDEFVASCGITADQVAETRAVVDSLK